jgi:glutamate synthase (NADPH/NADH) large chain
LENVDETLASISKVTPRDFQAVLRTRAQATQEGLDPDGGEVWSRILEVTGG